MTSHAVPFFQAAAAFQMQLENGKWPDDALATAASWFAGRKDRGRDETFPE